MTEFIKPTDGYVTSLFGPARKHPIAKVIRAHQGCDISNSPDRRVWAAAEGYVRLKGYNDTAGNYVIIRHPSGKETNYSHLAKVHVLHKENVKQGQVIGIKGETGGARGIHLHFEISKGYWSNNLSNKLDPLLHFVDPVTMKTQSILKNLGYDVVVDGHYGIKTFSAVALYQKRAGLEPDGFAGRATVARMNLEEKPLVATDTPKKKEEVKMHVPTSRTLLDFEITFLEKALKDNIISDKDWLTQLKAGKIKESDWSALQLLISETRAGRA